MNTNLNTVGMGPNAPKIQDTIEAFKQILSLPKEVYLAIENANESQNRMLKDWGDNLLEKMDGTDSCDEKFKYYSQQFNNVREDAKDIRKDLLKVFSRTMTLAALIIGGPQALKAIR